MRTSGKENSNENFQSSCRFLIKSWFIFQQCCKCLKFGFMFTVRNQNHNGNDVWKIGYCTLFTSPKPDAVDCLPTAITKMMNSLSVFLDFYLCVSDSIFRRFIACYRFKFGIQLNWRRGWRSANLTINELSGENTTVIQNFKWMNVSMVRSNQL